MSVVTDKFKPGSILPNGRTVIDVKRGVVLALLPGSVTPFATWVISDDGDTFQGSYYQTLDDAIDGFRARAK